MVVTENRVWFRFAHQQKFFRWYGVCHSLLVLYLLRALTAAADPVTLYYENRPPFMVVESGQLGGTEGRVASDTFKAAGIEFKLSEAPVARQVEMVGNNLEPSCAVGLYWTPARANLGKYSSPIFMSLVQDVVIRADNPKMQLINSMAELLATPSISLVLRNGYSYGPKVDALLERAQARLKRPPENSHGRIKMVLEGMADAALFTPDEAGLQISQFGAEGKALTVRHFADTPPGEPRHLYCSKSVDDVTMSRLNAVLKNRQ